ncbi:hypothetical protein MSAN_01054100 [Mycena sanguinolenta]|uniref:Uncharacterized protein n=1 Tax=Mycena sanguinolenta TaxID=230812 RepID=A0A8H7D9M1_9AGAR|nr:hypothetical protein MSAN_01054100 [Mycena sanguinolenta]
MNAMSRTIAISLAAATLFSCVAADSETTLIVPFADPQPISADLLGVDTANGRTTWQLHQGAFTGTWTDPQGSFPGTATLVEGADYASFTYAVSVPPDPEDPADGNFVIGGECSFSGSIEVCVVGQSVADGATTQTQTDTIQPFGLQIAATGAAAGSTPAATGGAQSGSTPSAAAPSSTHASSAARTSISALAALVGLSLASGLL